MRKKRVIPIAVGAAAAVCIALIFAVFPLVRVNSEAFIIFLNWRINLMGVSSNIYYKDTGPSVQGDGPRLTVMKYKSFQIVSKSVKWENGPDKATENAVSSFLTLELQVDKKDMPDFNTDYKYYSYPKVWNGTGDAIWLIYNTKTNMLYAIEDH